MYSRSEQYYLCFSYHAVWWQCLQSSLLLLTVLSAKQTILRFQWWSHLGIATFRWEPYMFIHTFVTTHVNTPKQSELLTANYSAICVYWQFERSGVFHATCNPYHVHHTLKAACTCTCYPSTLLCIPKPMSYIWAGQIMAHSLDTGPMMAVWRIHPSPPASQQCVPVPTSHTLPSFLAQMQMWVQLFKKKTGIIRSSLDTLWFCSIEFYLVLFPVWLQLILPVLLS